MDILTGVYDRENEDRVYEGPKIIFCSRTHSQLTQFVNELRKVSPPSSLLSQKVNNNAVGVENIKQLSLGSRRNLCINKKVSSLTSTNAINDRCLELQKSGIPNEQKCPYLPSRANQEMVRIFGSHALARLRDIEDLARLGRDLQICPYYASRAAVAPSEVLTIPYPLLLQKSAREAMGLSVRDNIVIIDEAHNLMDAISDTFAISFSLTQLEIAVSNTMNYVQKFKNKLKGQNRVYVTQVVRLLRSIGYCLQKFRDSKQQEGAISVNELMAGKGVDQIRPHKLVDYLQQSKLAYKVDGYAESTEDTPGRASERGTLMHLQNFLIVLMNPSKEGRFFASRNENDIYLRYILLDPREHFREIVETARAVILAGGTMSPMSDYADYLFSYVPAEKIEMYSFPHVIPVENLYAQPLVRGPSGIEFDFTFEKRASKEMITDLGRVIRNACRVVPDGIVVFFPSYDYLAQVVNIWKMPTSGSDIFNELSALKKIFEESKGIVVDDLLRDYAEAVDSGCGGLMLSVVGGKLSEGINFSDKLGRAVIAVGLPFPNITGAEWKAKIQYVEEIKREKIQREGEISEVEVRSQVKAAGRDFYENACMRAVNQCIGRAIRHRNDYAAIMLVDRRFTQDRIERKLPKWIRSTMDQKSRSMDWAAVEEKLTNFFASKQ